MTSEPTERPDGPVSSRARTPVSAEERARIVELIQAGGSRNGVAREVGRSPSTVSGIAEAAGLSFDRSEVEAATKARQADNRDKRANLQALLLDDALRLREQLWEPALIYNWSKDNDYAQRMLERPDFAGQATILRAVGLAVDKSVRLAEVDSKAQDATAVVSLLGSLVDGLRDEFGEDDTDDGSADPPETE